ncbi:hypothetical protein ACTXJX_11905 [Glutamicibacter ardleyensis]|uniref:hypothetical protein n=1 Tax=Glutamicibacter ardleyensis TaxID=225894 RepID=UPI003FD48077
MAQAETLPAGITGFERVPYGEKRWNGVIWTDSLVDTYNHELTRIQQRHEAGMDVQHLVNGLYNLAHAFDHA